MSRKKQTAMNPISSQKGNAALDPSQNSGQVGMRVIAVKTLREFWVTQADAEQPLKSWYKEATDTRWNEPNEVKRRYPSADILQGNRIVFNIKGNSYRLIVQIHDNTGIIFIRFVGTHEEYGKMDAETI